MGLSQSVKTSVGFHTTDRRYDGLNGAAMIMHNNELIDSKTDTQIHRQIGRAFDTMERHMTALIFMTTERSTFNTATFSERPTGRQSVSASVGMPPRRLSLSLSVSLNRIGHARLSIKKVYVTNIRLNWPKHGRSSLSPQTFTMALYGSRVD